MSKMELQRQLLLKETQSQNQKKKLATPINALRRIKRDYIHLKNDPLPHISAEPLPRNMLEWHYVIYGLKNTPYSGGYYHGKLKFPIDFPFRPPSIYMLTPNGRFQTNTRLCMSISDFHPDNWNPTWSVSTILTGLLSFLLENTPTYGSVNSSTFEKQRLAKKSLAYNLKNYRFCNLFPEICKEIQQILESNPEKFRSKNATSLLPAIMEEGDKGVVDDKEVKSKTNGLRGNSTKKKYENGLLTGSEKVKKVKVKSWNSCIANIITLCCLAVFMWIVHCIMKDII